MANVSKADVAVSPVVNGPVAVGEVATPVVSMEVFDQKQVVIAALKRTARQMKKLSALVTADQKAVLEAQVREFQTLSVTVSEFKAK